METEKELHTKLCECHQCKVQVENIAEFLKKAFNIDGEVKMCSLDFQQKPKHNVTFELKDSKAGIFYITLGTN